MRLTAFRCAAVALLLPATLAAQSSDTWRWRGTLDAGRSLEIRNINGRIAAEPASGREIEIVATKTARKGSVADVELRVETHDGGVVVCALWPSRDKPTEGCRRDRTAMRERDRGAERAWERWNRDNQVDVHFEVRVPRGVRLAAGTVNGDVRVGGLSADAEATSVNGDVHLETRGLARATTVNGSVTAVLGRADWDGALRFTSVNGDVRVSLPANAAFDLTASTVNGDVTSDFPLTLEGRLRRQKVRATVGAGGRDLELTTVNGAIAITKTD